MKIIILNQKGGVGKSTVTVNLGYGLAGKNKKTLIIDLDPQAHSTVIYMPSIPSVNINGLFDNRKADIAKLIYPAAVVSDTEKEEKAAEVKNLSVIPSDIRLAASSEAIITRTYREKILDSHLKKIEKNFDYILIDCPPTLGVLTVNAIYTADLILIPTNYGKYSLDGISDLFRVIAEVKESESYDYKILRNMKDARSRRTNEVIEERLSRFGERLFKTVIRRCEVINQAQMINQPVFIFDPKSAGTEDFTALTKEVLNG